MGDSSLELWRLTGKDQLSQSCWNNLFDFYQLSILIFSAEVGNFFCRHCDKFSLWGRFKVQSAAEQPLRSRWMFTSGFPFRSQIGWIYQESKVNLFWLFSLQGSIVIFSELHQTKGHQRTSIFGTIQTDRKSKWNHACSLTLFLTDKESLVLIVCVWTGNLYQTLVPNTSAGWKVKKHRQKPKTFNISQTFSTEINPRF